MPAKDGFELCDMLKNDERTSHIPIVLLTAKGGFRIQDDQACGKGDAYLPKPFEQEELLVRLEQLLILRKNCRSGTATWLLPAKYLRFRIPEMEDGFIQKLRQEVIPILRKTILA